MKPKGILVPIGGGEDRERDKVVLAGSLKALEKENPVIEIITTATSSPRNLGNDYKTAFDSFGIKEHDVMHIDKREDAEKQEYLDRINKADGVFFTGGDQSRISNILVGTAFGDLLVKRYMEDKFIIAGTSAGAAAMSETIIVRGSSKDALLKGELALTVGFGFLKGTVIDTHFTERGRFGRLIQAVATNPTLLGIGLGEDTGAIIINGNEVETIGSGLVVIVDGSTISHTNLTEIKEKEPISIHGAKLHILAPGDKFLLDRRVFVYD